MGSVHDVAAAVLRNGGEMTTMKLQKLVYYAQAWSLVWDERPLFHDRIEAWANGPVVPALYDVHKGQFSVAAWPRGDVSALDKVALETVASVVDFYGKMTAQALSDLTHAEPPWRDARKGLAAGERASVEITTSAMAEYYGGL